MNYENKYKNALERARAMVFESPEYKNILASVFPELKESDDERIRKEITDFIERKFENSCSPTPSKNILANWISWLESKTKKTVK